MEVSHILQRDTHVILTCFNYEQLGFDMINTIEK
jgi:hypothetical protein